MLFRNSSLNASLIYHGQAPMMRDLLQLLFLLAYIGIISCKGSGYNDFHNTANNPGRIVEQQKSSVTLKVVTATNDSVIISLKNATDRNIYVSYVRPTKDNLSTFLSNVLEQQNEKDQTFKPIGPTPHFGPPPLPISPGQEVLFKPFFLPEKKGKYRVKVAYLEDAEIYKLIVEKSPNWTDDELQAILAAWKDAWSDTFDIK